MGRWRMSENSVGVGRVFITAVLIAVTVWTWGIMGVGVAGARGDYRAWNIDALYESRLRSGGVLTVEAAWYDYDTDGMAFSGTPGTRGYYQYARWSERASKRFGDLLLTRLERERIFATVAQTGGNVRGNWLLTTDILDLHHDAAERPGVVRMELRAEVVDLGSRALLARKTFVQSVAVPSYDAAGAHQAFDRAATLTLDAIADWLKALANKP